MDKQREELSEERIEYFGPYPKAGTKIVKSLKDFSELAQERWHEAVHVFYDPCFIHVFHPGEEKERLLYQGFTGGIRTDENVEEFLLACHLKEPVLLEADQTEFVFSQITDEICQNITLTKSAWGYIRTTITWDGDFIELKKRCLEAEDFLGKEASFSFYIKKEKLHAGNNFGRLIFRNMQQEITVSVCAKADGNRTKRSFLLQDIYKLHAKLLHTYAAYRLKQMRTGQWAFAANRILDDLIELDRTNVWYRLLKAQVLWQNGQRQEAEWLLDEFKRKCKDRKSPQWGYYMYINTLMDHEELYITRLTEEIERIYLEHKESPLLFWCLLFLKKEYAKNPYEKIRALEERVMGGSSSPLFYVEAYCLFCKEPYLLRRIGDFEIRVLNWARKQNVLTQPMAEQVISVFPENLPYKKTVYLLLKACYDLLGERAIAAICSYLIRSQQYGKEFFSWYALGVEHKLRITGLYEAYLLSMDQKEVQEIPRIIQMYFQYSNQPGIKQKSILYVNMIAAKEKQPGVFLQHYPEMEQFAFQQMKLGRIDDNLAVIYKEALSGGAPSKEILNVLPDVLFMHRLTCFDQSAVRVIVLQAQLKKEQSAPITDHEAYFPLYSNDYCILIEDGQGNRRGLSVDYQLEKMMNPGKYLRACMENSPGKLPCILYYFSLHQGQEIFEEEDLPYFQTVMDDPDVSPAYRASLFPRMFRLMYRKGRTEEMEQAAQKVDFALIQPDERKEVLLLSIRTQIFETACQIAGRYGLSEIPASERVGLIRYQLQKAEATEDPVWLSYCLDTFLQGSYDRVMLEYLCRFYEDSLEHMIAIFQCASKAGMDTKSLAEKILTRMIETETYLEQAGEIYQSYESGGDPVVKKNYLSYFSRRSFLEKKDVPEHFFASLLKWQAEGNEINEICGLAILQYYTKHPDLMKREKTYAKRLLQHYLLQGMQFAFYQELDSDLKSKYQIYGRYYIEYRTKKHSRVWICYEQNNQEQLTEEMPEVYEGIFVKEMILFAGEETAYRILEEIDGETKETDRQIIKYCQGEKEQAQGRYERLNEILLKKQSGEDSAFVSKLREYEQLDSVVEETFTILE